MKNGAKGSGADKNMLLVTYLLVAVFVSMVGYLGYFLQVESRQVINNSYNGRLDRFADRIVRGQILSRDGRVLAETRTGEDGQETRVYPYGSLFAHVVGYSSHGKTGIEALANFYLLSSHVNLAEKVIRELSGVKNAGDRVVTTLDVDLQQAAWDALGERRGAVVVLEPDTGKVLAMVSRPAFDPNTLAADWDSLIAGDSAEARLLNRAAQGVYPPGSVFKIVTMLAYMREHRDTWADTAFDCGGRFRHGDYTISCYHGNVHGPQTISQAFANSCNGAFASLGLSMNRGAMKDLAGQLLFNGDLPLSLAYSKSSYSMEADAGDWEILQTSIGQGSTQMTPIHTAMITAAIANGGILMKPYLMDHVEHAGGETVRQFTPQIEKNLMTAEEAAVLTDMMAAVVTMGTGSAVNTEGYTVAGKTGSAEFEKGRETHGWFTGFAPADQPELVVTVIVEESGSGGKTAAPVARAVFDVWFGRGF